MSRLPRPGDAARLTSVLAGPASAGQRSGTSSNGVWRVAEDDPDSDLYAASSDASTVIAYIQAHS